MNKKQQKSNHRNKGSHCTPLFDAKRIEASKDDIESVKCTSMSLLLSVKFAERIHSLLNSLDKCDNVWEDDEKLSVASKVGTLAAGPVI